MTVTTQYPDYLVPAEDAREHSELSPQFSDAADDQGGDPDAPWGRKADGSPKAKPGRPAGTPDRNPRTRTRKVRIGAAAPKPRKQASRAPGKSAVPDYRPGILGLIQIVATPLAVAGIKNPAFAADAVAVAVHAEPLADALQATAEQQPAFAAALDKLLAVGPYGALMAAVIPLAVQIGANHGLVPAPMAAAMGAKSPQDLLADAEAQGA